MGKEFNQNMLKRAFTALIVTLPVILILLLQNFWVFFITISLISLLAYYEWLRNEFRHPILWGFNLIFGYFWLLSNLIIGGLVFIVTIDFFEQGGHPDVVYYIFLSVIINTAIFDTCAYIIGSNIGRNSIAPTISPNKTWEGLAGGQLGTIIYGAIICSVFNLSILVILVYSLGGIIAFMGDLLISSHKREKNIKDTGNVLPGHGGILDRLDSHLLATPITMILLILAA